VHLLNEDSTPTLITMRSLFGQNVLTEDAAFHPRIVPSHQQNNSESPMSHTSLYLQGVLREENTSSVSESPDLWRENTEIQYAETLLHAGEFATVIKICDALSQNSLTQDLKEKIEVLKRNAQEQWCQLFLNDNMLPQTENQLGEEKGYYKPQEQIERDGANAYNQRTRVQEEEKSWFSKEGRIVDLCEQAHKLYRKDEFTEAYELCVYILEHDLMHDAQIESLKKKAFRMRVFKKLIEEKGDIRQIPLMCQFFLKDFPDDQPKNRLQKVAEECIKKLDAAWEKYKEGAYQEAISVVNEVLNTFPFCKEAKKIKRESRKSW
jgi:hypothetical protein